MINIEQTEEYKNKLLKTLENQQIDYEITKEGLKREIERYKKNMDVICNMLSLAEIRALEKSSDFSISSTNFFPTYQLVEKIIEDYEDPDVTIPLTLDFNEHFYMFENYPYEQLKILEKKYESIEGIKDYLYKNLIPIVSDSKRQEAHRLKYENIGARGLNLGSLDQMDIYYSVFVPEILKSNVDLNKKNIIFDSLIRSLVSKSSYLNIDEFETMIEQLRKKCANIDEVIEFHKKNCDKYDLFQKVLSHIDCYKSFNVNHCIEIYNVVDKYINFNENENIDFATNQKISSIPYVVIRSGDDPRFLKLFDSETYKKLPDEIKENDIVSLLLSNVGASFSLKNVIKLDSFKINDMNMSLICGIITDWCNEIVKSVSDDAKLFDYLFKQIYNDEINNTLIELYKKASTDEEKNILKTYIEKINSIINDTIERFYLDVYRREIYRNTIGNVLGQVSTKADEELVTKYPNSKVNKKLKQVLTVSEVLDSKEDE